MIMAIESRGFALGCPSLCGISDRLAHEGEGSHLFYGVGMSRRSLGRSPQESTVTAPIAAAHPDGERAEPWPSRRFKRWPLKEGWTPSTPEKRVGPVGYQKVVGSVQHLFTDATQAQVLTGLQDYCFQQGEVSNTNGRDRAWFIDILTHDLAFFEGDRERRIIEDMPLDPKVYDALPQMEASIIDLYRVDARGILGGLKVTSLLRGGVKLSGGGGLLKAPSKGSFVLGRFVQIGRGLMLDEPFLVIEDDLAATLVEYEATRQLHPTLTRDSLLKVAGYHLYEEAVSRLVAQQIELPEGHHLDPLVIEWVVQQPRHLPDLSVIEGAKRVEADEAGRETMVTVALSPHGLVHRTLREAVISIDDRTLSLIAFIDRDREALIERLRSTLPKAVRERREPLSPRAIYRSLRHALSL